MGRAVGPRAGDDEIYVSTLGIHVLQPARGVVLGRPHGDGSAVGHVGASGQVVSPAAVRCRGRLCSGHPLVAHRRDRQYGYLFPVLRISLSRSRSDYPYVRLQVVHAVPHVLVGVLQKHLKAGIDVRVDVDDPVTLSHRKPPSSIEPAFKTGRHPTGRCWLILVAQAIRGNKANSPKASPIVAASIVWCYSSLATVDHEMPLHSILTYKPFSLR